MPVIKACRCSLPVISCSEILKIGVLLARAQQGTRIGRNWDFFRLPLSSSCGQFCGRRLSDPNPANFWEDELERGGISHSCAEDLP